MVAIFLCIVQLLPVLALTLVTSRAARLGIILALIITVSTLNVVFPHAVRAANFGAIAAYVITFKLDMIRHSLTRRSYSAVVVVFITQGN